MLLFVTMKNEEQPTLIIGPKNAEQLTGWPWRHVRDHARRLGVPILTLGRKHGIDAKAFFAAVRPSGGPERW